MPEVFTNLGLTTVSSGGTTAPVSGTVETWTVASSASFPAAVTGGNRFRVVEDDAVKQSEIILVTNVSGTTWTVTRGAEGTTPVAHTTGFTIVQVISKSVLDNWLQLDNAQTVTGAKDFTGGLTISGRGIVTSSGATANKLTVAPNASPPASPATGDIWVVSDVTAPVTPLSPLGLIGAVATSVAVTLNATAGVFTQFSATNITVPVMGTNRTYKVSAHAKFNMQTGGVNGLYRVVPARTDTGASVGLLDGTCMATLTGGPGQITTDSFGFITVPAGTSLTFCASGTRAANGTTTDSMTQAWCSVEDVGGS